jgi:ribosomal protein L1
MVTNEFKVAALRSTVKFQLKKVLCLGVAVGNVTLSEEQLVIFFYFFPSLAWFFPFA